MIWLLLALTAHAADTMYVSYGPLVASARDTTNNTAVFLGGVLRKADDDRYLKLAEKNPEAAAGPEQIYLAELGTPLHPKAVFAPKGFHVNNPAVFRAPNSETIYLFFTRVENRVADTCRKTKEPLDACAAYSAAREIGVATSEDGGKTFAFQQTVVDAKTSGDGSAPGRPAVLFTGTEVWLYYGTGKASLAHENLFRLRLSPDAKQRLAKPEPLRISGYSEARALRNVQLVRLRCGTGSRFITTLVGNSVWRDKLPFYVSADGLNFRRAAESLVSTGEKRVLAPTQLPGPASAEECRAQNLSGVSTARDLLYAEQAEPNAWRLRRAQVSVTLP